jgi:mRNA interferase MazF
MTFFPGRGEIYWVKLDPAVGSEISKTRPAIIISNDTGNRYSDRVIVAPITSKGMEKVYPFEVEIAAEGGVSDASKVLLDQIRTIDKSRLGKRIGRLSQKKMEEVNLAIRISLAV